MNENVTMEGLIAEIDQHVTRLRAAPPQASGQQALIELGGTMLPLVRDMAAYIAMLEAAVARAAEESVVRMDQMEEAIAELGSEEQGTRFTAEDATRFLEFFEGVRLFLENALKLPGMNKDMRESLQGMAKEAAELSEFVQQSTMEDAGEDEEGADEEDEQTEEAQ